MAKKLSTVTFSKIPKKTETVILNAASRTIRLQPKALKEWQDRQLPIVEAEATRHYQNAVDQIGQILNDGIDGADSPRSSVTVARVTGGRERVAVGWRPLAPSTLLRKEGLAFQYGKGKAKRSPGAGKFWLDRGQLRGAYARLAAKQVTVVARLVRVRTDNGLIKFDVALELSRLHRVVYLNDAIRRSLIEGFEGAESVGLSDMGGAPGVSPVKGLLRGFWAEARRPLMRPVSRRLGKTMRNSVIKSFKRRR